MKKCPFCAEEIRDAAIVCRYCGRDLVSPALEASDKSRPAEESSPPISAAPSASPKPVPASPKYRKTSSLALGCLAVLLIFLFLVYIRTFVQDSPPIHAQRNPTQSILYAQQQAVPIHKAPSTDAPKVGELDLAARVVAVGQEGQWTKLGGNEPRWVKTELLGHFRPLTLKERQERIDKILAEVRKIPASEALRNRNLYKQLTELDPDETSYQRKFEHYSRKVEEQEELARRGREREQKERQERLARFGPPPKKSAWDATYREVRSYLERVANDPDSIEIDACTEVYNTTSGWLVGCDYRGRNAFGGMVRQSNWFTIVHGRVTQMHAASEYSP